MPANIKNHKPLSKKKIRCRKYWKKQQMKNKSNDGKQTIGNMVFSMLLVSCLGKDDLFFRGHLKNCKTRIVVRKIRKSRSDEFKKKLNRSLDMTANAQSITNVLKIWSSKRIGNFFYVGYEDYDFNLRNKKGDIDIKSTLHNLATGLKNFHQLGMIHRNISPDSIVFCYENGIRVAKLSDTSFSKTTQRDHHYSTSEDYAFNEYSSPELLKPGNYASITSACDVHSLANTLFFAITGKNLFERDGNSIENNICDEKFIPKYDELYSENYKDILGSTIDIAQLIDLLQSMVNFDPEKRPTPEQILKHPYLWTIEKRTFFIYSVKKFFTENWDLIKSINEKLSVYYNWKQKVDTEVKNHAVKQKYYNSPKELWRFMRNMIEHVSDPNNAQIKSFFDKYGGPQNYFCWKFPWIIVDFYNVLEQYWSLNNLDEFYS